LAKLHDVFDHLEAFEERVAEPREWPARAPSLEVAYALEPLQVLVIRRGEGLDRYLGQKQRDLGPTLFWVDGRRDDGKPVGREREVDQRLAAAVFQTGFLQRPPAASVHNDRERAVRAKHRSESRDELSAPEPIAGDDAQTSRLICHPGLLTSTNVGA
jgi:hypothetical protein